MFEIGCAFGKPLHLLSWFSWDKIGGPYRRVTVLGISVWWFA